MHRPITEDEMLYLSYMSGLLIVQPKGLTTQMALLAGRPAERQQLIRAKAMPVGVAQACFVGAALGTIYSRVCLDVWHNWDRKR